MNKKYFAALLAFVGAVLFSAKAVFVKLAYLSDERVDHTNLLLIRMALAIPIYLVINWLYSKNRYQTRLESKQVKAIILAGIGGYYLASLFDFMGLEYISAGMERVILFIFPTLVVLISAVAFKKKITTAQVLALLITYVGIFIAVYKTISMDKTDHTLLGCILVFLSAVCYASYLVGIGQIVHKVGTIRFTTYSMSVSFICILLHYLITARTPLIGLNSDIYGYALLMAVVSTVVPSFMVYEAIRRIGSSNAAIISGIGPVSTIVLAYFFLGETMGALQIIGTILVISGVVFISIAGNEEKLKD